MGKMTHKRVGNATIILWEVKGSSDKCHVAFVTFTPSTWCLEREFTGQTCTRTESTLPFFPGSRLPSRFE